MFAPTMISAGIYKPVVAFILLAAFLTQSLSRYLIIVDYYTNTAAYTQNCENKAKPQLQCNGKCQLEKKLNGQENKDKQNPSRKADIKDDIFSSNSFSHVSDSLVLLLKISYPLIEVSFAFSTVSDIFHPPQATQFHLSSI